MATPFSQGKAEVPFSDFLARRNKLPASSIERAIKLSEDGTDRFGAVLLKLGLISESDLAEAYASYLGTPVIKADEFPSTTIFTNELSSKFLKRACAIPVEATADYVVLALADPLDRETILAVEYAVNRPVKLRVALASDITKAFESLYGDGTSKTEQIVANFDQRTTAGDTQDAERLKDLASEAPIIQLVNFWIERAVEAGASDIHIEPSETSVSVRFRLDGQLTEIEQTPSRLGAAISSRIKVMARLNIAERRLPQDGKLRAPVRGREIDFRVSVIPTVHGESIVLRILDRSQIRLNFASLGYDDDVLTRYHSVLQRPHGILLVTGPTGSGKTTTLYTSLLEIRSPTRKILTVEDPVEYQLEGINQTQVHPQIGLTFANTLRSFLRHDPDVMLIGEIRDTETAHIAVQAALTGHLVLSTLHTNDAPSAVTRLLDMGVDNYLITASVNGIAAQRLVRKLCPACRQAYSPSTELRDKLNLRSPVSEEIRLYRPVGCSQCKSGYAGRLALVEFMTLSERICELIMQSASVATLREAAQVEGLETMYQNGIRKCLSGTTTVEEVMKATSNH